MMSQHFKALGPHLYMFQLHSAFEQAPSELCLSEKRLRNLIQNNADNALTMGLFVVRLHVWAGCSGPTQLAMDPSSHDLTWMKAKDQKRSSPGGDECPLFIDLRGDSSDSGDTPSRKEGIASRQETFIPGEWGAEEEDHSQWDTSEEG